MDENETWGIIGRERAELADLLEGLTPDQWACSTLCAGWTMREMAAHLSFGSRVRMRTVAIEIVRARGGFDRMVDTTARRDAARPADELIADLRAAARSRRLAPGQSLTNAVLDVMVHGQDIAVPLGLDRPMPLPAARLAAEDTWRRAFPFHARKRLHGLRLVATDIPWTAGEGAEVEGPISALLMLLTGRDATVDRLAGPGAVRLKSGTAGGA